MMVELKVMGVVVVVEVEEVVVAVIVVVMVSGSIIMLEVIITKPFTPLFVPLSVGVPTELNEPPPPPP